MMRARLLPFLMAAFLPALAQVAVARDDGVFDKTVAADPRGIVEVSNFAGRVDVSTWDRAEVSVHADLPGSPHGIEVRSDNGRTAISVRFPGISFGSSPEVSLKIRIPAQSELDVSAVSADVFARDVMGPQRLKSVSGSITADLGQGDVEAKTVSGDIVLHGRSKPGQLHASTISGSIKLDHGSGDVEATSVSGDLQAELDPGRAVRMRTTSGEINIQGKLARDGDFDLQSVSGEVKVHVAPEAGYQYDVSTFSGSLSNCFHAQSERTSRYGPGERLSGSLGTGNARLRIKTMSGDVDLCDRS